jgi:hypothetical protein
VQLVTGVRYQESTSGCTSVLLGIQFKECAVLDLACRCAPTEWQRTGQACVRAAHLTPQVVCARKELKGNMHRGSEGRGEAQGSAGGGVLTAHCKPARPVMCWLYTSLQPVGHGPLLWRGAVGRLCFKVMHAKGGGASASCCQRRAHAGRSG